jgi:SecD/SecF fusion protein
LKPQQLIIIIALLALTALGIAVTPVVFPETPAGKLLRPKMGLDIQGGARVVLEADTAKLPKGQVWNGETRNAIVRILDRRVNASGVAEPVITPKGDKQFVVEIPAVKNEQDILNQLQNTAQLQFYYVQKPEQSGYSLDSSETRPDEQVVRDIVGKKTYRDPFHINQELSGLVQAGASASDAEEITPPSPLGDLAAAAGKEKIKIAKADVAKLTDLAEELKGFNTFLASTRLELDGSDMLPVSKGSFDTMGGSKAIVQIQFNNEGTEKFARFTRDHTNEILMIYLDGRILMAPNIHEPILNGKASISPFATLQDANAFAAYLNGGALPVPLKIVQQQSVEATLGNAAVQQSFVAGLIGLGLVIVFMVTYYLLPGSVACIALILYTLFTYAVFVIVPVTFTLPGIAGFILSVGMAVDANILIFERTKEELRAGKPLRQAVEAGFSRAFSAIFDSNMCTAVTSLLLYWLGTGAVRGFALTLLLGVLISMFTAITVTRTLLLLVINSGAGKNLEAWGLNRQWHPRMTVVKKRSIWYALSLAIIVPGIVFVLMGGLKYGIDFTGGSELTVKFNQTKSREEIEKAVTGLGIKDPGAQIAGNNIAIIRLPRQEGTGEVTAEKADEIVKGLQAAFPNDNVSKEEFSLIGGAISAELTRNALASVGLSSLFIVFYLAFRFAIGGFVNGLKFGVGAIIAMLHDILVLVGTFAILGHFLNWKVDTLFVTAALTVIGFSVHDTIIIFDRIRENLQHHRNDEDFGTLVNSSINETFARSINTSGTVIITLAALLVFGGATIRPLNAALLIGIISGTYSSIFNAAPLVVDWQRLFGGKTALETGGRPTSSGGGTPRPTQPGRAGDRPAAPPTNARPTTMPKPRPATGTTPGTNGATGANGSGPVSGDTPRPGSVPPGPPRPRRRRM